MLAVLGKLEVLARVDGVRSALVADDALAFQAEDDGLARRGMLGQPCPGVKAHEDELHLVVVGQVHVDDLALLDGEQLGQLEDLAVFEHFVHGGILSDFDFGIDASRLRVHAHGHARRREDDVAFAELPGVPAACVHAQGARLDVDELVVAVGLGAYVGVRREREVHDGRGVMLVDGLRGRAARDWLVVARDGEDLSRFLVHALSPRFLDSVALIDSNVPLEGGFVCWRYNAG